MTKRAHKNEEETTLKIDTVKSSLPRSSAKDVPVALSERSANATMFFNDWTAIARVAITGLASYAALVFLLRISGKRTLTKMNAFDFVVTVALGSTLASVLLSRDVPLAEGLTAFALLLLVQYVITWLSVRSQTVSHLVKSTPRLLFHRGKFLEEAMKQERINKEEILQAVRSRGFLSLERVGAVVLETDGSISVMQSSDQSEFPSALSNVRCIDEKDANQSRHEVTGVSIQ